MKIIQSSDYRIYIDDVRVDAYVKNWTATCGLRASDATASITMYRTKKLEQWKGYLAQVRIFGRNVFSGKFGIVFEGEIVNRNWGDQRSEVGEIIFSCKGFYHWLDIPIPLLIGEDDSYNFISRFQFEAQNIDISGVNKFWLDREEMLMKDLTLQQVIDKLFDLMNSGYNLYDDSTFTWAKLQKRFKVMGDIITEFRSAGYLDAFTFVRTTQIDSFYVYLNQILTQMMFEFYQDRDGALRIKNPSWSDDILKAHVFDEAVVLNASGFNDWANEPTRVLVVGGPTDTSKYTAKQAGADGTLVVPMGLYIGLPGKGDYYSQNIEVLLQKYGDDNDYPTDPIDTDGDGVGDFFDDISGNYTLTSKMGAARVGHKHQGNDFSMPEGTPLHSLGVDGEVFVVRRGSESAGNYVVIKEEIDGQRYDFVYMHMNMIEVKVGDKIKAGARFGTSGRTGVHVSGPHLHLEIWVGEWRAKNSYPTEPYKFLEKYTKAADTGKKPTTKSEDNGKKATGNLADYLNKDLKKPESIPSAAELDKILNKNAPKGSKLRNQGKSFVTAAKEAGLNPLFLIALAGHESGWGTNPISKEKNGFYSIGAIDSNPLGGAYSYDTPEGAIVAGAIWIREKYYDRGQTTLYKMSHSKSGSHNYASDDNWASGIVGVWKGFGKVNGTDSSTTTTSSNQTSSPNAGTNGYVVVTRPVKGPTVTTPTEIAKWKPIPVDYKSFSVDKVIYPIPATANAYKDYIMDRPNGVNSNLICCIIEIASVWKEKNSSNGHYGLMGVPKNLIDGELNKNTTLMYDPIENIFFGSKQFKAGYDRYSSKVTFGLASLYLGDISKLEPYIKDAGAEDFSKVRNFISDDDAGVIDFVDSVIKTFCTYFGGNYIKGDPHMPMSQKGGGDVKADNPEVKDYESTYKPVMSDEERLYKVNLKISEQLLIRYETPTASGKNAMNADNLVQRYAKYIMQLYRAESHGVTVSMSTCMPFVRPGFNAWLEPTRRNAVFYVTGVSHQGSYGNGAFSTVTGGFVRDPKSYDDIEDNIFVGETNVLASDFGAVVNKKDMDALKNELATLHIDSDEVIGDARKISTLSKMYSSAVGKETNFTTMWNNEFTSDEIENKITALYKSAPAVVKKRRNNFKNIIVDAADFYTKILLKTPY